MVKKDGGKDFTLTRNFRSTPALITFVNYLMEKVKSGRRFGGGEHQHIVLRGDREGETGDPPVEILLVTAEKGVDRERCRVREAGVLARRIKEIVERESRDYGDVAILFRSMTYAWIYEMALRREGVPYALLKGGMFFERQEIRDIINVLKAIDDEGDEIAIAGLLRSPFFGVSDDTLYRLCANKVPGEGLLNRRDETDLSQDTIMILDRAADFLVEAGNRRESTGIFELISWILEKTLFQEVLLGTPGGERKVLNINKLLQLALGFESNGLFTLSDFVRYLDHISVRVFHESEAPVESGESGIVRVMWVDSAKGLEFPVVILPDLLWSRKVEYPPLIHHPQYGFGIRGSKEGRSGEKPRKYKDIAFINREEDFMESGRLFYVATTRARDKLVLSASVTQKVERKLVVSSWIRWIRDLLPEDVRGEVRGAVMPKVDNEVDDVCEVTREFCVAEEESEWDRDSMVQRRKVSVGEQRSALPQDILVRIKPIEQKRSIRELSVTQILDYMDCPKLYHYRHVLKYPDPGSVFTERFSEVGATSIGEMAHRLLELWDLSSKKDLEHLIEILIPKSRQMPGRDMAERVMAVLQPFCESDLFHEMQRAEKGGRLRREFGFTVLVGGTPVSGSIDAVFLDEAENWVIVDYKTLEVTDGSPFPQLERFERQLKFYAMAFGMIKNVNPRRASIYYLPTGYSHHVDLEDLDGFGRLIHDVVRDLRNERFVEEPSKCEFCDMVGVCQPGFV
jgi:ATP-dependent helicase/nuclease subunit A